MNFSAYLLFISLSFLMNGGEATFPEKNLSVRVNAVDVKPIDKEYLVAKLKKPLKM